MVVNTDLIRKFNFMCLYVHTDHSTECGISCETDDDFITILTLLIENLCIYLLSSFYIDPSMQTSLKRNVSLTHVLFL